MFATARRIATGTLHARHINAQWVHLLDFLGMNIDYASCRGTTLRTADGRRIPDFLSGYCVYNIGHNHPDVLGELIEELHHDAPTMLQSHVPVLAGELAGELCRRAGGGLEKAYFTSSGSEGIETAIKFARAHTRRPGLISCQGAFHGLTMGALSIMGNPWWSEGFGPLLAHVHPVPFGDLGALEEQLSRRQAAAFVVEPIQAEAGIRVPAPSYLAAAQDLCRQHGTLMVLDEVQTGFHRCGPFLAAHSYGLEPDMVVLAKAMSGGLVPVGALLMRDEIHRSVYSSLSRAFIQASTFGENRLAMRAGLRSRLAGFAMIEEIRGAGLLCGIAFRPPTSRRLKFMYHAFQRIHPGMFGQMLVSDLFRRENILTQTCGNNFMVLKAAPPLTTHEDHLQAFVDALERTVRRIHAGTGFWRQGLGMIPRALRI
ncbi:MAG: aspartate aminotransferase family protein [Acidobacteriota bacterium]